MGDEKRSYALEALEGPQREAVEHTDGPLLVFAGPGTGKTRVVVHKIAHLVGDRGYRPDQVLALTFSESAAQEMLSRVEALLPGRARVRIATFHSFCNELVREHTLDLGVSTSGGVITEEHQKTFLLENLDRAGLEHLKVPVRPIELAKDLQGIITRLKQENVPLERLERYLSERKDAKDEETATMRDVARAYRLYEEFKARKGLIDFGDMQHLALRLLTKHPAIVEQLRGRYRYIIVDEFQDTDYTQLQVLLALAGDGNVTVVGDDDQSIYRFRGAYLTNVHEFLAFFRGRGAEVKEVVLDRNFRCTGNIQSVASALISNNPERQPKQLRTLKSEGPAVTVTRYRTDGDQARGIAQTVRRLHEEAVPYDDIAIMVRSRFHATPISDALERARLPFEVLGSRDFFRHRAVKAAVAYLRVLNDPILSTPDLALVLGRPAHGIPPGDIPRLARLAKDRKVSLWEALGDLEGFEGDPLRLKAFREGMDALLAIAGEGDLQATVRATLFGRDLFRVEIARGDAEGIRNLNRLLGLASEFQDIYPDGSLADLVRYLDALRDIGLRDEESEPGAGRVHLMTIHGAKGREFPYVLIPCLSENRVPTKYRPPKIAIPQALWDGVPSKSSEEDVHYQEERRLLYVGITRAKERAFLSLADRYGDNKTDTAASMYMEELLSGEGYEYADKPVEVAEEPEERADSLEGLLHDRMVGDVASGDYRRALDSLVALAKLDGVTPAELGVTHDVDLEALRERLRTEVQEPEAMHAATTHFSPSRLRAYEDCPAAYRFEHVLGIPGVEKTFFELGTVVHAVIEAITRRLIEGKPVDEAEALGMLDEAWRASVWGSQELERQDREAAEKMIRDFLARQAGKHTRILGIEQWIDLELEGYRISGKIDRVDDLGDHLEVIDYKTSRNKESKPGLKSDYQMVFYWEGAEKVFGKPVRRVGHWYLRHDQEVMVEISREERDEVLERAREVIRGVRAGRFEAKPDFRGCQYCDYADLCDARHL